MQLPAMRAGREKGHCGLQALLAELVGDHAPVVDESVVVGGKGPAGSWAVEMELHAEVQVLRVRLMVESHFRKVSSAMTSGSAFACRDRRHHEESLKDRLEAVFVQAALQLLLVGIAAMDILVEARANRAGWR